MIQTFVQSTAKQTDSASVPQTDSRDDASNLLRGFFAAALRLESGLQGFVRS